MRNVLPSCWRYCDLTVARAAEGDQPECIAVPYRCCQILCLRGWEIVIVGDRESFEAATTRFAELLRVEGCAERVVSVWPEDVLATGKRIVYVREPVPSGNAVRAREMNEQVMGLDCGLRMADVCVGRDATYCCMWGRPEDPERIIGDLGQESTGIPRPVSGKRQAQMTRRVASRRVEDIRRRDKINLRIRRLVYFETEGARVTSA